MKNLKIFLMTPVLVGIYSCTSPEKKKAQVLSETLNTINDSLAHRGQAFARFLSEAVRDKQYDKIAPARLVYEEYIDSCGRFVKRLDDVAGSEQLKRSALAVLGFEKHMIHTDIALFDSLNADTPPGRISGLFSIAQKDERSQAEYVQKFKEILAEYDQKNGISEAK